MAEPGDLTGNRVCSGRRSLEAFGQRRDKFKLPGPELSRRAKAWTVCSGIKTSHSRKPTGLTVQTVEKSEGQKHISEVKWPSGPPRGPCSPRAQCVSPWVTARAPHLQACLQPSSRLGSGSSLQVAWPRLPPPGWSLGPAGGGQLFSSSRLGLSLVRSWAGHGLRK